MLAILSYIYLCVCLTVCLPIYLSVLYLTLTVLIVVFVLLKIGPAYAIYIAENLGGKEPKKDAHFHPCSPHSTGSCSHFAEARKRKKWLTSW